MEKFNGVGRKNRRIMIRLWKESGCALSLKEWAKQALTGDIARVWLESKKESDDDRGRSPTRP